MLDPTLYLSMILGLGGIFILITSFDDDDHDDGERFFYNLETINLPNKLIYRESRSCYFYELLVFNLK